MLENNFNELDNDFVTIWSRYIVNRDETQIMKELEKLAELGQINAIQSFYFIIARAKLTNTNSIIDSKVDEISYSRNFNYILAYAYKLFLTDKSGEELIDLIRQHDNEIGVIESIERELYGRKFNNYDEIMQVEKRLKYAKYIHEKTKENIKNNEVVAKEIEAVKACHSQAKETQNPYAMERYLELFNEISPLKVFGKQKSDFKREIAQTHKELAKRYKSNPTPQNAFALGKSLAFFGKKDKSKQMGIEILTKLAERPLSKTLNDYINNGKVDYQGEDKPYLDLE